MRCSRLRAPGISSAYRLKGGRLPSILCVIDEFADLMMQAPKRVEASVTRLGQLGRACGVHLVLGTQSPHAKVLSGLIKANIPARIALRVASGVHSRVAIDQGGAEDLLGRGDALLQDGQGVGLQRFQSAFVPAELVERIVAHWKPEPVEPAPEQDERLSFLFRKSTTPAPTMARCY